MSAPANFPQVSPDELAAKLREQQAAEGVKKVLVLDVRDEKEVVDGAIKGAVNIPSSVFTSDDKAKLDEVIKEKLLSSGAEEVVVHCQFCVKRGPTCARALAARLQELEAQSDAPEVKFLTGGVQSFLGKYHEDKDLSVVPDTGFKPLEQH